MVEFKTPKYEGPLDLLLALIQKAEVNIYDIPIALITDQFLDYLHKAKDIGLGDLSEFYKMASELIWIKSQMMLPIDQLEFDQEYYDPREELVERLLEYSKFKKYSELLTGNVDSENYVLSRKSSEFTLPFSDDELWENVDTHILLATYKELMKSYDLIEEKVFNVYENVTEKEKIALMNELFESRDSIMFSDLFVTKAPAHILCSFLAVLEAAKDHMILIDQPVLFGDMTLTKRPIDWDPNLVDEYDNQYDEIVENNLQDQDNYQIVKEDDKTSES